MSVEALPCIKCGKPLKNVTASDENQPYCGTEFMTLGHYGSTIHDEIGEETPMALIVNICDTCILRAIEANVIQSRAVDGSIRMAHHHIPDKGKAWVLAQNEKQYGSAWGEDTPQDYRKLMLEAGWPEHMLDADEEDDFIGPHIPKDELP